MGNLELEPRADSEVSLFKCKITTWQYLQSIAGFSGLKLNSPFTSLNENRTFGKPIEAGSAVQWAEHGTLQVKVTSAAWFGHVAAGGFEQLKVLR